MPPLGPFEIAAKITTNLVHVSDHPALGDGELDGNVAPLEVAPAPWRIICRPVVVLAVVQGQLVLLPAVAAGRHALSGIEPVTAQVV